MSADDDDRSPASPDRDHEPVARSHQPEVDVERLAEKVYQLMLAEARLAVARHER